MYDAVVEYAESGTLPKLKPMSMMAFEFIRSDIDRNNERYEEIIEKRRDAGKKGRKQMVANDSKCYQVLTNEASATYNDNVNVNVNVNDNVSLYVREITHTDTESFLRILLFDKHLIKPQEELDRFLAYYSKTGWLDRNGNKIVDKVAALKSWDCKGKTYESRETASRWHQIVNRIENNCDYRKCPNGRLDRIPFLADFRGLTQENGTLTLYCSNTLREALESVLNQKIVAALNELEIRKINYRKKE